MRLSAEFLMVPTGPDNLPCLPGHSHFSSDVVRCIGLHRWEKPGIAGKACCSAMIDNPVVFPQATCERLTSASSESYLGALTPLV